MFRSAQFCECSLLLAHCLLGAGGQEVWVRVEVVEEEGGGREKGKEN